MGYIDNDPCLARAEKDEPIFVGLGRDPHAALMTRVWAALAEDCQPSGQVTEAIEHAARMLRYCEARNPGRRAERIDADAIDRAIGYLAVEASRVRKPRFGDVLIYRETIYYPEDGGRLIDEKRRAVVIRATANNGRLTLHGEDSFFDTSVARWRPLAATDDMTVAVSIGWCWPHEADDLPPVAKEATTNA